jgi:Arc/MetJ-type ribon-helix-helix transcriptional regulator
MAIMTLTLTPETQRMVEDRLKDGTFRSFDEIVHAGLAALNHQLSEELDEETLDAIDEAEDQIERGEVHNLEDVEDRIRQMFNRK